MFNILTKDNLSESDWEDVEDTLLLADVGAEASEQLVGELRRDARITGKASPDEVRATLRDNLLDLVGRDTDRRLNVDKPDAHKPGVIIMVGVNGTGKTTTAGKLARLFVSEDKKVVMGAADTFRAAAADQLETWGARVNVPVVRSDKDGADPASVAFEAAARAKEDDADVSIIDTAGRLQNKSNLMDELGKIRRVTEKNLPVDEVLLVLDATTGQNGMAQAKVFAEAIGLTGVVLSEARRLRQGRHCHLRAEGARRAGQARRPRRRAGRSSRPSTRKDSSTAFSALGCSQTVGHEPCKPAVHNVDSRLLHFRNRCLAGIRPKAKTRVIALYMSVTCRNVLKKLSERCISLCRFPYQGMSDEVVTTRFPRGQDARRRERTREEGNYGLR